MGCDGGTIPRRDELVRLKKKPEQKDKDFELIFKWRYCALTQEPLQSPIVACGLGRLYNKQPVIEGLLAKSLPESCSHIKNLSDIKDIKLAPNPAFTVETEKNEGTPDVRTAPFICPIIGLEMSGRFRFVFIWSCGCVMSERALKELKANVCVRCQQAYTNDDIVVLNGTAEDLEVLTERMATRKAKAKELKKLKKKQVSETVTSSSTDTTTNGNVASTSEDSNEKAVESTSKPSKNDGKSLTNLSLKRPGNQVDLKPIHAPDFKKAKSDYSVAKDPKATDVFKSLFTSHATEQQQDRAHWITYNPFYN